MNGINPHKIYHQFKKWLENSFGKDLIYYSTVTIAGKDFKTRNIKEPEFSSRLCGFRVIERIEKYATRHPEIKICRCDDSIFAGSIIVLVPHPMMGISVFFIPQCTSTQNELFLYQDHLVSLIKYLDDMGAAVYPKNGTLENKYTKLLKKKRQ